MTIRQQDGTDQAVDTTTVFPIEQPPVLGTRLGGLVAAELTEQVLSMRHVVADAGTMNTLTVRAGSVIGTLHELSGMPRQDSYYLGARASRAVFAVCDGVGSQPMSHHGAMVAAHAAVGAALQSPALARILTPATSLDITATKEIIDEVLHPTGAAIAAAAAQLGMDPDDLSTTLALAAIDTATATVLAIRVGDSNIRTLSQEGHWASVFDADDTMPSTLTQALPRHLQPQLALFPAPVDGPLLLVSDGVDKPLRLSPVVAAGLAERWRAPRDRASFLSDLQFVRVDAYDDRTAILVWATGPDTDESHAGPAE